MPSLERQRTRGVLAGLEHGKEFRAHRLADAGDTDGPGTPLHLFNQSVANQHHFNTYALHDELRLAAIAHHLSAQTLKPREATDVDVEVVEPAAAVLLELTLKLFLGLRYGQTQTAQGTPTPGPPQTLSGDRDGNFPCWNTVRAFARHAIRLNPVENGP